MTAFLAKAEPHFFAYSPLNNLSVSLSLKDLITQYIVYRYAILWKRLRSLDYECVFGVYPQPPLQLPPKYVPIES